MLGIGGQSPFSTGSKSLDRMYYHLVQSLRFSLGYQRRCLMMSVLERSSDLKKQQLHRLYHHLPRPTPASRTLPPQISNRKKSFSNTGQPIPPIRPHLCFKPISKQRVYFRLTRQQYSFHAWILAANTVGRPCTFHRLEIVPLARKATSTTF